LYINDLPKTTAGLANPVLFADDTSMIISKSDPKEFTNTISRNIIKIKEWCKSNSLLLNIDKTYFVQFCTKTNQKYDIQTSYENRQIAKAQNIKFLGIVVDSKLSWKQHIDDIIPKLNKVCFAIRSVKPFMSLEVSLISTPFYHMGLYSGVIQYIVSTFLKFKREQLELLQMLG
jgi:hypothetical protein